MILLSLEIQKSTKLRYEVINNKMNKYNFLSIYLRRKQLLPIYRSEGH
jgi:hypothetical protein